MVRPSTYFNWTCLFIKREVSDVYVTCCKEDSTRLPMNSSSVVYTSADTSEIWGLFVGSEKKTCQYVKFYTLWIFSSSIFFTFGYSNTNLNILKVRTRISLFSYTQKNKIDIDEALWLWTYFATNIFLGKFWKMIIRLLELSCWL